MRPRESIDGLPVRVYQKHGAFYYVSETGKWHHLGRDRDAALALLPVLTSADSALLEHLRDTVIPRSKRAAAAAGRAFSIDEADLLRVAARSNWRCAVSGVRFSLDVARKRKPFAPSLDRIDCSLGYVPGNVRLVCVAVNIALADWGDAVFEKIALHYARKLCEERFGTSKVPDNPLDLRQNVIDLKRENTA